MSGVFTPPGNVNCGGHFAASCASCPAGNGRSWCNGDCIWVSSIVGDGDCEHSSFLRGMPELDAQDADTSFYWWMATFVLTALIMLIYAVVYKKKVVDECSPIPSSMNIAGEPLPLLACLKSPHTMLYTLCCMPIVLGKNYWAAGLMGFWPGCLFSFLLSYTPLYPFGVCVRAILSKKVQDTIGHDRSWAQAMIYSLFCMPCDVGRESMEVDAEIGAEITCCCKVEVTSRLMNEMSNVKTRMCPGGS